MSSSGKFIIIQWGEIFIYFLTKLGNVFFKQDFVLQALAKWVGTHGFKGEGGIHEFLDGRVVMGHGGGGGVLNNLARV